MVVRQRPRFAHRPIQPAMNIKIADVEIVVNEELCKGCGYCITFCPMDVLDYSPHYNKRGVHPPMVKNADACIGCGMCEEVCPDFAIYLIRKEVYLP